jgi:hypothetical protein
MAAGIKACVKWRNVFQGGFSIFEKINNISQKNISLPQSSTKKDVPKKQLEILKLCTFAPLRKAKFISQQIT